MEYIEKSLLCWFFFLYFSLILYIFFLWHVFLFFSLSFLFHVYFHLFYRIVYLVSSFLFFFFQTFSHLLLIIFLSTSKNTLHTHVQLVENKICQFKPVSLCLLLLYSHKTGNKFKISLKVKTPHSTYTQIHSKC